MTAGGAQKDYVGGWDGVVKGFVAAARRPYGPNATVAASTVGGKQYESHLNITLSQGNWWIGHNGNWLGYYPAAYFNLINARGCAASWYGEVFDPTPTDWTSSNMGSGQFSSLGYGKAAHVRNPFYADAVGVSRWPDASAQVYPYDAWCYTASPMYKGSTNWERYFYLGGPGGDSVGCN